MHSGDRNIVKVPLLDLRAQFAQIRDEVIRAVTEVFESQQFILGQVVESFEASLARYCGSRYAVGVSSGSDALLVSMMAEGIGAGDEVITTPFTFFATAGSIVRTGARPVFVDIEPDSFNIDPAAVEAAVTSRTRAIVPVHLYGRMCRIQEISSIARRHGLLLIEDAAQAIGAEINGQRAGTAGDYGCLSFFPSKNLGGAGDGGAVLTGSAERADLIRRLRNHGAQQRYYHDRVGGNFRLDALQAAVLQVKLKYLDRWIEQRQQNARRYSELLAQSGLVDRGLVAIPEEGEGRHVFHQYVIRAHDRDRLRDYLRQQGIGCEVYYPVPLHLQKCFAYLGYAPGAFPESERAAREVLALPMYPELEPEQIEYVVETIGRFYAS